MSDIKVIAHRGANKYAPQNTIPAFERAIELGVDGFETDIHLTKDGVPVICHNYTVNDTSNGMGNISSYEFEDIRKLDFGSYFSPRFAGTKIPTIDEFLDTADKGDVKIINIELKSPKNGEQGIVEKTIEAVKNHHLSSRLLISSFDYKLLVKAKEIDPDCRTAYLYSPNSKDMLKMWFRPFDFAEKIGCYALHPMYCYVTKEYVKRAHDAGLKVNVWTIDSERMIKYMVKCGVDGLITDCPDRVNSILRNTVF